VSISSAYKNTTVNSVTLYPAEKKSSQCLQILPKGTPSLISGGLPNYLTVTGTCKVVQKNCGHKAKQKCVIGVGEACVPLYAQLVQTKIKQCNNAIILQCYQPYLSDFCFWPRLTQPYNYISIIISWCFQNLSTPCLKKTAFLLQILTDIANLSVCPSVSLSVHPSVCP